MLSFLQGASAVKEELLDDIIKDSAPYQAPGRPHTVCYALCPDHSSPSLPDKIQTRSEMSASKFSSGTHREEVIEPNE